jgi:hypothetical protein
MQDEEHENQKHLPLTNEEQTFLEPGTDSLPAPLNLIRTPIAFTRLPFHQLSKTGMIDIRIMQRDPGNGRVVLYWKIAPNSTYGIPRQLAYKLDTLIINRRLDEVGWPVPRIVRLGSLHAIARELGLTRNTDAVKNALRQDALTGITAKLTYTAHTGSEERIDATFTRYSVIFRGDSLNGRKAETVYLIFNDPYFAALNNTKRRPLDWDYLKALTPSAQRFYELLSFEVYGTLKHQRPYAKIRYSKYCQLAPQVRYYDRQLAQKQMNSLHRPHIQSGYLERTIRYERLTDDDGKLDWLILYTPGPKAQAHYRAADQRHHPSRIKATLGASRASEVSQEPRAPKPLSTARVIRSATSSHTDVAQAVALVRRFHELAHGSPQGPIRTAERAKAQELLDRCGAFEAALHAVDYACAQMKRTGWNDVENFGAVLANNYPERARAAYEAEHKAEAERVERAKQQREQDELHRQRDQEKDRLWTALSQDDREQRITTAEEKILERYPEAKNWPGNPQALRSMAERRAKESLLS